MPAATQPTIEALYEEHFDFVWSNLRRLGVPAAQLEDAAHDVFSVVHRRRDTYDGRCRIETWLFGIVRRIASHHRRREARHRRRIEAFARDASPPPLAETSLVHREALRQVESFLAELDPRKREVFVLAHIEQMTGREIAEALAINPNTASARLRAARAELRRFADAHALGDALDDGCIAAQQERAPEEPRRRVLAALMPIFALPRSEASSTATRSSGLKLVLAAVGVGAIVLGAVDSREADANGAMPSPTTVVADAPEPEPARQPEPEPRREPAVRPPPAAPPEPAAQPEAPEPAAVPESPSVAPPVPKAGTPKPPRRPAPKATAPKPNLDDLEEQTRLARRVSNSSGPAQALERIAEYGRRFPSGFFSERLAFDALAALCKLGRRDEAKRKVSKLRRKYPGSTLLPHDPNHPCGITKPDDGGDAED